MLSPRLELDAPTLSTSIAGSFASLPQGVWSSHGRAELWFATPAAVGGLRGGVQAAAAGLRLAHDDWSAAASGVLEVLWAARGGGIALGAGPSTGWIAHQPSVTALRTRARAWARRGAVSYALNIEPTRFLGAWFTDVSAGLRVTAGVVTGSLWTATRFSTVYGSKGAGSASIRLSPRSSLAIEISGGSYLPEPYQGFPGAGFVTAGIRLFTPRRAARPEAAAPSPPPLRAERRDSGVVVRFRMDGARSVAIAGSWDGWRPHSLMLTGQGLWTGTLAIAAGTYHFDLLVDGKEWVVPAGVALVTDRRGGMVGVLVVP